MQPGALHRRPARMMATRAVRGFFALLVAGALTAVPVSAVLACSCAMGTIADSMGFADVVFTGTANAVEAPPPGDVVSTADPVHYGFAVDQVFKGELTDAHVVAATAMDGASCGTSFGMDERWLVFGNLNEGELWTGLCSGNVLLSDDEIEAATLAELGEPIAEPEQVAAEPEGFEVPVALIAALAVGAVVIGVSAWAFVVEPRCRVS